MHLHQWQQRVVDEKAELDGKLERLKAFFSSKGWSSLDAKNQNLLREQADHMTSYSIVLGERIALFGVN